MAFQVWIHVGNRGFDLFFCWFDGEELDQLANRLGRIACQFTEVDPMHGHVGVIGEESLAMLEQRTLQFLAVFITGGDLSQKRGSRRRTGIRGFAAGDGSSEV
nr:hypothetical protein [Crateriforma spongiae]